LLLLLLLLSALSVCLLRLTALRCVWSLRTKLWRFSSCVKF